MAESKLKIAFVHNAYLEYRTPLFKKISEKYTVQFFFEWVDHSFTKNHRSFRMKILRYLHLGGDYAVSPLLFFLLIKGKFNFFIAGGKGQVNTYVAYLVSRLLRKPFIFWDETWYWPATKSRLLAWPIIRSTLKNSSAIIVPGTKSKKFYASITPCGDDKILVAPNASWLLNDDQSKLEAQRIRERLKLDEKKVILYCGRLIEEKGVRHLIDAFAKLQRHNGKTVLLVIGEPSGFGTKLDLEDLKRTCRELGIDGVHFLGAVYSPEKTAYFLLADVVVVPSIFWRERAHFGEIWGFTVNEAMSVGKPVVATSAVGAAYDLIKDDENGYIVPDKDSVALYRAINEIISNPSKQKRMGARSSEILLNEFTYESMFCGFKEAIKYALSRVSC